MKYGLLCGLLATAALSYGNIEINAQSPQQKASWGSVEREYLWSPEMRDTITLDIFLPEGLDLKDATKRHPVVYMHDGQNLYDASTTWNRQSWEMDSVIHVLTDKNLIEPPIVVGIHSFAESRLADLMPENVVTGNAETLRESFSKMFPEMKASDLRGNAYSAFVANTLKQHVDSIYPTIADKAHTAVMGSSMGGLISLYIISEYPEVFGNAGCLSTHWIGAEPGVGAFSDAMKRYVMDRIPSPSDHKLYFDHGTEDIDAPYGPAEEEIVEVLHQKGYVDGESLMTVVDEGAGHREECWMHRVANPLTFFFKK